MIRNSTEQEAIAARPLVLDIAAPVGRSFMRQRLGSHNSLLKKCHLDSTAIAAAEREILARKGA